MLPHTDEITARLLQEQMIALIRALGLHRPDETPCGKPVSVAEAHALMELTKHAGLSQNAICQRLRLQKSTISRVISLLAARGWIERRKDPRDGRAVALYLTDAGKTAARDLAQARERKFRALLDRISPEQRPRVLDALHTLVEALREG
jgi:DNA-binding MarR family transcriptional regulator